MSTDRKAFEAWWRTAYHADTLKPMEAGCYLKRSAGMAWDAWMACTAQHPAGDVVVTRNESGAIVAVTRQDEEGKILSVIAEAHVFAPSDLVSAASKALDVLDRYEAEHVAADELRDAIERATKGRP